MGRSLDFILWNEKPLESYTHKSDRLHWAILKGHRSCSGRADSRGTRMEAGDHWGGSFRFSHDGLGLSGPFTPEDFVPQLWEMFLYPRIISLFHVSGPLTSDLLDRPYFFLCFSFHFFSGFLHFILQHFKRCFYNVWSCEAMLSGEGRRGSKEDTISALLSPQHPRAAWGSVRLREPSCCFLCSVLSSFQKMPLFVGYPLCSRHCVNVGRWQVERYLFICFRFPNKGKYLLKGCWGFKSTSRQEESRTHPSCPSADLLHTQGQLECAERGGRNTAGVFWVIVEKGENARDQEWADLQMSVSYHILDLVI